MWPGPRRGRAYSACGRRHRLGRAAYTVTRVPDWTDDLEVFCADIGSIARNKFAWARRLQAADDEEVHAPASIDSLAAKQAAARVLPAHRPSARVAG